MGHLFQMWESRFRLTPPTAVIAGTSVHFIPIPLHPAYSELAARPENQCPAALDLYPRLVSLPLCPEMTEEDVRYVAATARDIVVRAKKYVTEPVHSPQ